LGKLLDRFEEANATDGEFLDTAERLQLLGWSDAQGLGEFIGSGLRRAQPAQTAILTGR
jgi:hypothetical protein